MKRLIGVGLALLLVSCLAVDVSAADSDGAGPQDGICQGDGFGDRVCNWVCNWVCDGDCSPDGLQEHIRKHTGWDSVLALFGSGTLDKSNSPGPFQDPGLGRHQLRP